MARPALKAPRTLHVAGALLLPGADLGFRLVVRDAVAGLDLADELIAAAFDRQQVVVRELAPLLLHGGLSLAPPALDLLPHRLLVGLHGLGGGLRMNDQRHGTGGHDGASRAAARLN